MNKMQVEEVEPVDKRETNGNVYVDEYTFGKVHVEDIPKDFQQNNVTFRHHGDNIYWEYEGKVPIIITEDRVLAKEGEPIDAQQKQAYFALSILSDEGFVSNFSKK